MTLLQLLYVEEICNCNSINKAAKNLYISQSSLSTSIKELETELGVSLFYRSNLGTEMTAEGRLFLEQIKPLLEQHRQIKEYYSNKPADGIVRLHIAAQRFPFCVKAFVQFLQNQKADRFDVSLHETEMMRVIEQVAGSRCDLGIISISDITEKEVFRVLSANGLVYEELKIIKPHAYMSRNHPLAKNRLVGITELLPYPYLVFTKRRTDEVNFSEEVVFPDKYRFEKTISINDRATAYNVMAHTLAFTTGSGVLPPGYSADTVVSIPLEGSLPVLRLGFIQQEHKQVGKKVLEYLRMLEQILQDV